MLSTAGPHAACRGRAEGRTGVRLATSKELLTPASTLATFAKGGQTTKRLCRRGRVGNTTVSLWTVIRGVALKLLSSSDYVAPAGLGTAIAKCPSLR